MLAISKDLSNEELEFFESMARLQANPFFKRLAEEVVAERDRYLTNLVRHSVMLGSAKAPPIDQREIDYKRGFWNGAIYAVSTFPTQKAKNWERFVAENKESDVT